MLDLTAPDDGQFRKLERVNAELKAELAQAKALTERLERELGIMSRVGHRTAPPAWLTKTPRSSKRHNATAVLLLSDLHLDEVVEPAEVLGVNAYNRAIAHRRLEATAGNFVKVCRDYWTGIDYDGVLLPMLGDIFSGDIHDELKETNEDTLLGSLDHWIEPLGEVVALMADEFGRVHVPVVVGNHGRTTRKPRAKYRARSNFDWFLGMALQRLFAADKRVTFDVSESADCVVPVYDKRIMLTHGDQATGGAGIGGIWPPLMRLDARKRQRQSAVEQPYDLMCCGHWHVCTFGPSFIVNGSLKGLDEYAFQGNFGFEPPAQAAFLVTPEHGRTWMAPIYSQDRQAEGW